ncbi:MAG TPA: TIGR03557 family F420-dependent LLM class oxidoreductase [Candidatus Binatia bacterium]|nr:TIGR03557 family F420-dependent LLM class oxidoreductase [Candidatus Binatia bacterium]
MSPEPRAIQIGYKLSSEEFGPRELVRQARRAEEIGFRFGLISDHFHPWTDRQGQSPFVWSVLGGIAEATERLVVGTGVTCPTIRMHPAIVAHAAATAAAMLPGRFFLGVGSGENLNEHITGHRWPPVEIRQAMLEEAVAVIRLLWQGGYRDHYGRFYTVENARLYTRPPEPPPIYVAAGGPKAAALAARVGDGLVMSEMKPDVLRAFEQAGGGGKPRYTELTVCWAPDEAQARRTAFEVWPIAGFTGPLNQDLAIPAHFEKAARMLTEDRVAEAVICGPDPGRHVEALVKHAEAGYTHVAVHQVGPDQEGFFRFYEREVLPAFERAGERRAA